MTQPDFASLTERERQVLRLVLSHNNSSEIARAASAESGKDVSPATVDRLLRRAMEKLSVGSRHRAAQIFADSEKGEAGPIPTRQDLPLPLPARPTLRLPLPREGEVRNDVTLLTLIFQSVLVAVAVGVSAAGMIAVARTIYLLWLPTR